MFTGIITDIGTVRSIVKTGDTRIEITTRFDTGSIDIGASICCSGACMTVVEKRDDWFAVEASAETLSKTVLGAWAEGTRVNLERALKAG
ncbi:MAG: riboflavin synthase, partial [Rhodospirillales bacterium]|nr:riboflavin synthase [Rhodospirillales bacterium]